MRRTAHTEPHAKKKLDAELAGDKKVPPPPHFSRRARSFRHVISRARGAREARRGRSSHARARILPKKLSCSQARREQGAEEARALRARDPAPSARARRARQDPVPNFHVDTAHTGALAQARPLILTRAPRGAEAGLLSEKHRPHVVVVHRFGRRAIARAQSVRGFRRETVRESAAARQSRATRERESTRAQISLSPRALSLSPWSDKPDARARAQVRNEARARREREGARE